MYRLVSLVVVVTVLGGAASTRQDRARKKPPQPKETRALLYPASSRSLSPALRPHVEKLLTRSTPQVQPGKIETGSTVFARVTSEKFVWDGRKLKDNAWLGSRPFVFLSVPETYYGRSVLEIYSAIGYAPRLILDDQVGEMQVAVLFTYKDAETPKEIWPKRWRENSVYPATWFYLFGLAEKMAQDASGYEFEKDAKNKWEKVVFKNEEERQSFIAFSGKDRIENMPYSVLKVAEGKDGKDWDAKRKDWEYRALLGKLMGAAEHYKGDGTTVVTLGKPPLLVGFPEYLGPNINLNDTTKISEIAIVRLGALTLTDTPSSEKHQ